ncbi:unnamed protein product, partial [Ectocarpus sp. 12 AP-2014]
KRLRTRAFTTAAVPTHRGCCVHAQLLCSVAATTSSASLLEAQASGRVIDRPKSCREVLTVQRRDLAAYRPHYLVPSSSSCDRAGSWLCMLFEETVDLVAPKQHSSLLFSATPYIINPRWQPMRGR